MPPGVVTVTSTVPTDSAGEVAVQEVVVQDTPDAGLPAPKSTVVPPEAISKPVPAMVTLVPPVVYPEVGLIPVTVGGG